MKNVENYEKLFKSITDAKTYSKSLAMYIDRKTSILREVVDAIMDIYTEGVLYDNDGSINEDVFPSDMWYTPITVKPLEIEGSDQTEFDRMYITAKQLAVACNGAIDTKDADNIEINMINDDLECTFEELMQACCDDFNTFKQGYTQSTNMYVPFDFSNNTSEFHITRGFYNVSYSEYTQHKEDILVRADLIPKVRISMSQTLQGLMDTVNQNKLTTILFNTLGTNKAPSTAIIMAEVNRVLGSAASRVISLDDTLYNLAVNESIPVDDRIAYMVESLNDQSSSIDSDLDTEVKDDDLTPYTFNASEYSTKAATAMWNGGVAGSVVVKACVICAKVIKAAAKIVFTVVKAVFKGLKRLWNKFVKPAYVSKDFVASESEDTDQYVDVPLFMANGVPFNQNVMANSVFSSLLSTMEYKYSIPDMPTLKPAYEGDRRLVNIKPVSVDNFTFSVDDKVVSYPSSNFSQRFKIQTRWEVENQSMSSVKNTFNLPSIDYQRHNRGYKVIHCDLPGVNVMIGDLGRSKMHGVETPFFRFRAKCEPISLRSYSTFYGSVSSDKTYITLQAAEHTTGLNLPVIREVGYILVGDGWTISSISSPDVITGYQGFSQKLSITGSSSLINPGWTNGSHNVRYRVHCHHPDYGATVMFELTVTIYVNDLSDGIPIYMESFANPTIQNVTIYSSHYQSTGMKNDFSVSMLLDEADRLYDTGEVTFTQFVDCVACDHIIFPRKEDSFILQSQSTNAVVIEHKRTQQRFTIELRDGYTHIYCDETNDEYTSSFNPQEDWTCGRYEYFEPILFNVNINFNILYALYKCNSAYFYYSGSLLYTISEDPVMSYVAFTKSIPTYYVINDNRYKETEWIDDSQVMWYSRPVESMSQETLQSLLSDCRNPVDIGCATVFRFKFGCMELYSDEQSNISIVAYANPIDHTQLLDSDYNWRSDIILDEESLFNAINASFTTKSEWTVDETGDVLAYKDLVASYKLWDLFMWMLSNPHIETLSYFSGQYPFFLSSKSYLINPTKVERGHFVDLLFNGSITDVKLTNYLYCLLYYIVSNKPSYMRIYYLLTGSFPTFIPYLVGDRLLSPKWHIQTDDDVQGYVDKVVTTLVVAALVIAATTVFGLAMRKIKKAVKLKRMKRANESNMRTQRAISKASDVDTARDELRACKDNLAGIDKNSDGYQEALAKYKAAKDKLNSVNDEYSTLIKEQARAQRRLNKVDKLCNKLGLVNTSDIVQYDSYDVSSMVLDTVDDDDPTDEIISEIRNINVDSDLASLYTHVTQISENVDDINVVTGDIDQSSDQTLETVMSMSTKIDQMSNKQDIELLLGAITTLTSAVGMIQDHINHTRYHQHPGD